MKKNVLEYVHVPSKLDIMLGLDSIKFSNKPFTYKVTFFCNDHEKKLIYPFNKGKVYDLTNKQIEKKMNYILKAMKKKGINNRSVFTEDK